MPSFLKDPEPLDKVLFVALMAMGVYSMALLAMRAYLLSHPLAYALMVGGYTSATVSGANASVGNGTWWVYLAATLVGALKFVPIYWLMGRRWGMEFIDLSLQYMPRAHRFFKRAVKRETGKTKAIVLGLLPLSYAPGPVPGTILNAIAGLLKVGLGLVMVLNVLSVLAINGLFMWLGHTFGDEVLDVVDVINRYLLWITLGLLALVVIRARKKTV
ncbi:DedA family protein [uncultured Corynebacterium sp.]|uniref:DedA family protein n=1 Tax=uncultured Corynebacterium sp. TaxID=159447 RepID=UPI00345DAB85